MSTFGESHSHGDRVFQAKGAAWIVFEEEIVCFKYREENRPIIHSLYC